MSEENTFHLRPDLLDDFYAECDEHLAAMRRTISALERTTKDNDPGDAASLQSLFASFHSFKGIAALAGVTPGEQLAHAAEDYLRVLTREKAPLTPAGLDTLMASTSRLVEVVEAHRLRKLLPDVAPEVAKLRGLAPAAPPAAASRLLVPPSKVRPIETLVEEAKRDGLLVWRCHFTPSAERDKRGVNITSVRKRLGAIGEILEATPQVLPEGGGIRFQFIVALQEPPADLASWEADGIVFENLPEDSAPKASPSTTTTADSEPLSNPSRFVRVDIARLDDLMRLMGDLVIHRARLDEQVSHLAFTAGDSAAHPLQEVAAGIARSLRELRQAVMRVRLVPVAQIFERLPFVVRDLTRETDKKIRVTLSGQETEMDKLIMERIKDPLLHLVRNCVSHGIEEATVREKHGKPAEAILALSASTTGDTITIEVSDDGAGIDVRAVRAKAAELGIAVSPKPDDAELLSLLCRAGLSTRTVADRAAGRGVGMSVVCDVVRQLGGLLTLKTTAGKGTRFTMRLPLTLAVADVFVVSSAGQLYAVPQTSIAEVIELDTQGLRKVGKTEVLHYRNGILPLVRLGDFFKRPTSEPRQHVLVIESERGLSGIVVDRVVGQREVVVRAVDDPFAQAPGIAGATELGDGRPVLILDVSAITTTSSRPRRQAKPETAATATRTT